MAVDTEKLRDLAAEIASQHPLHAAMMADAADKLDDARAEVELLTKQRDAARRGMESAVMVAELAWDGEIPSPLPFHRSDPDDLAELDAEEMAARDIDCPCCGGSGHVDDVDGAVTVLRWTRYDGTPETLPEEGAHVILVQAGTTSARQVRSWLHRSRIDASLTWEGAFVLESLRIGDLWAPWPDAPQGVEDNA